MKTASKASLLPVVIFALAVFAVLKTGNLWIGFSTAGAQTEKTVIGATVAQTPAAVKIDVNDQLHKEAAAPVVAPGEVERRILEQLAARRATLDVREENIRTREGVLAAAEKQIGEKIAEFERERAQLAALRSQRDEDQAEEIEALVSAYERMKAKDAAAIFNELDEDILVPVAAGMRTQALAGALSEMLPAKARKLTILLAERNQVDVALAPEAVE